MVDQNEQLNKARETLSIEIPPSLLGRIKFLFKDGDSGNWESTNVAYMFENGPLECPFYPGYYYVPGYSRYVISEAGDLITVKTAKKRAWTKAGVANKSIRGGYVWAPCVSDSGVSKSLSRHRAMALTFLKYELHPSNFIINHLNGIGGDDRIDNLVFCTHGENTKHAYDLGLYANKLAAIDVWNWITDFQKSYTSIQSCCDELNLTHNLVSSRLRAGNNKRFEDGWRFKRFDEEWLELNDRVGQVETERAVAAKNIETGVTYIFHSMNEAARQTSMKFGMIQTQCVSKVKIPNNGWLFRFLDEFTHWPEYSEQQLAIFKEYPFRPSDGVEVFDLETNQVMHYTSPEKAAERFGISPITVSKLARYGGIRQDRYKFNLIRIREEF